MRSLRVFLFGPIAIAVICAGFLGCAKKQVKTEEGQLKAQRPAEEVQKTAAGENGKPTREAKENEAPPGPKELPEPAEAAKHERALADVYFDFDKYDIRPMDAKILEKDYNWIKANNPGLVVIEGNCDERGTVEYNLALGERRAEVAKKYLVSLGVDGHKLRTISYGKSKPADPGHDEEAWAKNRRDHLVVN